MKLRLAIGLGTIISFLEGKGGQTLSLPENLTCPTFTSEEVGDILSNTQFPIIEGDFEWVIDEFGYDFVCLDFCPVDDLQVGPGVYSYGKCTYTLKNTAQGDMVGTKSQIVLKPVPLKSSL